MAIAIMAVAGCGFTRMPGDSDMGNTSMDLAGLDLLGVDFSTVNADLLGTLSHGPGPLGALPTGFCCNANEECRSRVCRSVGSGPKYCADSCRGDSECNGWNAGFRCDTTADRCVPNTDPYTCAPAEQFQYGSQAIGTCCASGFAKIGEECLGGLCYSTGANTANPFYCTQGCNTNTPCPGGYTCFVGFCWISQTVGDSNMPYTYTCK